MTKACNFPISENKRCTQPIADNKPNCGRHSTNLSASQLGQNPTVYEKGGELHVWAGDPDGPYCLIHNESAYHVLCQLAGETPPCCLREQIRWENRRGRLHRKNGPALIKMDGTQEWYLHGRLHRDDGPAFIRIDGTRGWYLHGRLHRENGPAVIETDGTQTWCQHGKRHRNDGPAVVKADGTQEWWWRGHMVTEGQLPRPKWRGGEA